MPKLLEKYQDPRKKKASKPSARKLKYIDMFDYCVANQGTWVQFSIEEGDFDQNFLSSSNGAVSSSRAIEQGLRQCMKARNKPKTVSVRNVTETSFEVLLRGRPRKKKSESTETASIDAATINAATAVVTNTQTA